MVYLVGIKGDWGMMGIYGGAFRADSLSTPANAYSLVQITILLAWIKPRLARITPLLARITPLLARIAPQIPSPLAQITSFNVLRQNWLLFKQKNVQNHPLILHAFNHPLFFRCDLGAQICVNKHVNLAIHHRLDVSGLHIRAVVFYHGIWMEHI